MEDDDELFLLFEYVKGIELDQSNDSDIEELNDLDDLRESFKNIVMIMHNLTEEKLNNILMLRLTGKSSDDLIGKNARLDFQKKMAIFNHMEFYNKIKAIEEQGYFNGNFANKILVINNIRNWFAHPSAYTEKIQQYNKQKMVDDLRKIINIFENI